MTSRSRAMLIALVSVFLIVVAVSCDGGVMAPDVRQVDTLVVYRDTTLMMCDCQPNRQTGGLNLHFGK